MINVSLTDQIYLLNMELQFTENLIKDYMSVYNCISTLNHLFSSILRIIGTW